jgi:hypothetical protein
LRASPVNTLESTSDSSEKAKNTFLKRLLINRESTKQRLWHLEASSERVRLIHRIEVVGYFYEIRISPFGENINTEVNPLYIT